MEFCMHIFFDLTIPKLKIYPPDKLAQILKPVPIKPAVVTIIATNRKQIGK